MCDQASVVIGQPRLWQVSTSRTSHQPRVNPNGSPFAGAMPPTGRCSRRARPPAPLAAQSERGQAEPRWGWTVKREGTFDLLGHDQPRTDGIARVTGYALARASRSLGVARENACVVLLAQGEL